MAVPFLVEDAPALFVDVLGQRAERSRAIADEVYSYFKQLAIAVPFIEAKRAGQVPPGAEIPEIPSVPPYLKELETVERWGLPCPGTWMDQPQEYLDDLDAARDGRSKFMNEPKDQQQQTVPAQTMSSKFDQFEQTMAGR